MALNIHFPVLPKFDKLTALYRPRRSISDMSPQLSSLNESTDSPRTHRVLPHQMSMSLTSKGLLNPTGENNCFLNSTIQVLWHIGVFRRSFREVKGHHCIGKSCIFCSLMSLFSQFQHDTANSAIPPDQLRQALAVCYEGQRRFQLGLMDDAAECFEKILEQIHYHLTGSEDMDTCSANFCISHEKFALTILERTECRCGATSEPLSFVQFVHYISSSAFAKEAEKINATPTSPGGSHRSHFSKIVNSASAFGETRQCANFVKCKQNVITKRILLNSPDVFCLGLIWDSASPSVDDIMNVVSNIGLSLQLNEVFDHVFSDSAHCNQLELTALIAYYGRHYSTFCYHSKLKEWIYFDDAKFRTIGADWSLVTEQIRKAHYQPLLLVYTNPFGERVDLSEAPTEIILTSDSPRHNTLSPVVEESPEETELTNQIADEAVALSQSTSTTTQVTMTTTDVAVETGGGRPAQMIDPMTLSIVPSAMAQRQSQHQVPTDSDNLMMFSLAPGQISETSQRTSSDSAPELKKHIDESKTASETVPSNPASMANLDTQNSDRKVQYSDIATNKTQLYTTTNSTKPICGEQMKNASMHTPRSSVGMASTATVSRPSEIGVALGHTSQPHNSTHSQPYNPTHSQPHNPTSSPSHSSAPSQNVVRPRPRSNALTPTTPGEPVPVKMRVTPKSEVCVGETKVHAEQHNYQPTSSSTPKSDGPSSVDLMTFSISPVTMATLKNHTSAAPAKDRNKLSKSGNSDSDLIQLSITPQHIARLQEKYAKNAGNGNRQASHDTHVISHDVHGNQGKLEPKWNYFSDDFGQRETKFGQTELGRPGVGVATSKVGGVPDDEHWAVLTMRGPEKVLTPTGELTNCDLVFQTESETPAVRSLKRMASLPDQSHFTTEGKPSSPVGKAPPTQGRVPSPLGNSPAQKRQGRDFSKRELPQVPIPVRPSNPSPNQTGTYAELDFNPINRVQSSTTAQSNKDRHDDGPEYAEVRHSRGNKRQEKEFDSLPVQLQDDSDTPIGAHPLYAVPKNVKRRMKSNRQELTQTTPTITSSTIQTEVDRSRSTVSTGHVLQRNSDQPIGEDPLYAVPEKVRRRKMETVKQANTINYLSSSTKNLISEARDLFAKAEAVRGSDDTVALVLLAQYKSTLDKVLRDPVVMATSTLTQQIRAKREEGVRLYNELKPHKDTNIQRVHDKCPQCGYVRSLDPVQGLCGPCTLRAKMALR